MEKDDESKKKNAVEGDSQPRAPAPPGAAAPEVSPRSKRARAASVAAGSSASDSQKKGKRHNSAGKPTGKRA
eukprot:448588-Prymnesium_polylepis.1